MFWTLLLLTLILPLPASAVTTRPSVTPSPAPTSLPSPSPTNSGSDEIQKIREVVQAKVKEKLKAIINPTSKKAYIGKVIQLDTSTLTIENADANKTFALTDEVVIVDQNRNIAKRDKLKINQDILAMGIENNTDGTFELKRIVFIDLTRLAIKKTVVVGRIVDISRSSPIFTLIPVKNKNSLFQIKTDAKTQVITPDKQKLKLTDIKSGHKVLAVLKPDEKISKTYTALTVMNFDYTVSTPSPTPSPKR